MDIFQTLAGVGNELDKKNMIKEADAVDSVSKGVLKVVQAQYAGFQGWAIRNGRCWGNCYRQKRAKSPSKAAQEVWMDCWKEYNDALKDTSTWDKYADTDSAALMKTAHVQKMANRFVTLVNEKVKQGMPLERAITERITSDKVQSQRSMLSASNRLLAVAVDLQEKDEKLASTLVEVGNSLVKNSGWFQGKGQQAQQAQQQADNALQQIEQMWEAHVQFALENPQMLARLQNPKDLNSKQLLVSRFQMQAKQSIDLIVNLQSKFATDPVAGAHLGQVLKAIENYRVPAKLLIELNAEIKKAATPTSNPGGGPPPATNNVDPMEFAKMIQGQVGVFLALGTPEGKKKAIMYATNIQANIEQAMASLGIKGVDIAITVP